MSARADRIVALLEGREVDALLITAPANLRWATGFTGSNGLAVVGSEHRLFVTDFRYVEQAADQLPDFDRRQAAQELSVPLAEVLADRPIRLGFDDAHLTVAAHRKLRERLDPALELVPAGGVVEELRAIKEPDEVERIRAAAALADEALSTTLRGGLVGRTEREVALALEAEMRRLGAEDPSFPSIVAGGAHGALPHAVPRSAVIPTGTLVVVDWGARLDGYCSDCTRTLATGELDSTGGSVYGLVLRAQEAALEAVRPGPTGLEIDSVAREIIESAGHGEHFGHGLGHGVGLEVHEGPRLSRLGEESLKPGHVVTVEPGVYVPGRLGVRIEDLVVVTQDGHEVLSGHGKGLTVFD